MDKDVSQELVPSHTGSVLDHRELMPGRSIDVILNEFEESLLYALEQLGLPTKAIFVPIRERQIVFKNFGDVLENVTSTQKPQSLYLSKFAAAIAAGLFDAALNYLWDETIYELRKRIAQYDISYFYDNVTKNVDKRSRLKTAEDLDKIDDSDLIYGARAIELITEIGFKQLDTIRYMRNWASAAHPNQNTISGLQLIGWLDVCIREVISLPLSVSAAEIKQLLANIKSVSLSEQDAREIANVTLNLVKGQINKLVSGLFGIYVALETTPQTRRNIRLLMPFIWERVDEETRVQLGANYDRYAAIGDQVRKKLTQEFLEIVSAVSYLPEGAKIVRIDEAIENLLITHRGMNNFHNEPQFAQVLNDIVGDKGGVPKKINRKYVVALVDVFLTNGYGPSYAADPIYRELIEKFDTKQSLIAILSFREDHISSKLQFLLCQSKYRELLEILKLNVSTTAIKELILDIERFGSSFDKLKEDSRILQRVENLKKIIN